MKTTTVKGQIYIIAAPSGAGKTSLVRVLCESINNLNISISYTTRTPRTNEQAGQDYHFVDVGTFHSMMSNNQLLEHAEVFGNFYGTSRQLVEVQQNKGKDIILELDWQGAQQIRKQIPQAISIFILPPSRNELRRRLESRGTDSKEIIAHRMAKAASEISHYHEFDYIVVNNQFDVALVELQAIIHSHRLKQAQQSVRHEALVKELLSQDLSK